MSDPTLPWSLMNPGTALAAGVDVDPAVLVRLADGAAEPARLAALGLADPSVSALDRMVLQSVAAQAATWHPFHALREALEAMRGAVYLGRPGHNIIDEAAALAVPKAAANSGAGGTTTRFVARQLLDGIALLGRDAGFPRTAAAAEGEMRAFSDIPGDGSWEWAATAGLGAVVSPSGHRALLRDAYGFAESPEEIETMAEAGLAEELPRLLDLARRIGDRLPGSPGAPELVSSGLDDARAPAGDALACARMLAHAALDAFDRDLIALDAVDRAVQPEATPAAMRGIVTEGEEYLAGGLTDNPRSYCFITEGKCGSVYTLANVVYHELAHCWNMLGCSREARALPGPLRVSGTLGSAVMEGIATWREWEVYELYVRSEPESAYGRIFAGTGLPRGVIAEEFEFDTRYWRVARLIRALFDARVHSSREPYADFVRDLAARTGFAEARIHGFGVHFLEKPGYTPCYAIGAMKIAGLQREFVASGRTVRDFNRRISGIGMLPEREWRSRIGLG